MTKLVVCSLATRDRTGRLGALAADRRRSRSVLETLYLSAAAWIWSVSRLRSIGQDPWELATTGVIKPTSNGSSEQCRRDDTMTH